MGVVHIVFYTVLAVIITVIIHYNYFQTVSAQQWVLSPSCREGEQPEELRRRGDSLSLAEHGTEDS